MTDDTTQLYIKIADCRTGGEDLEPGNKWSDRSPEQITLTVKGATFERNEGFWPDPSVRVPLSFRDAELLYLSVVRYSDGDTFGYTSGYYEFVRCYTDRDEALAYKPENDEKNRWKWTGYFAQYECLETYVFDMKRGTVGRIW